MSRTADFLIAPSDRGRMVAPNDRGLLIGTMLLHFCIKAGREAPGLWLHHCLQDQTSLGTETVITIEVAKNA
jgi:hypothetical protein